MSRRERFATQVAPDITARVRATVKGLQRQGWDNMSLALFTEQALTELCARMERDHHDDEQEYLLQFRQHVRFVQW